MLAYQLTRMCREKGAVRHDDRVDALALGVKYFLDVLAISAREAMIARKRDDWNVMLTAFLDSPQEATDALVLGTSFRDIRQNQNSVPTWT
jgi:hypothetical protein